MYYKKAEESRGRPTEGIEKKAAVKTVRIEPYLNQRLTTTCKLMGISHGEAIRQGILLFLREADKQLNQNYR